MSALTGVIITSDSTLRAELESVLSQIKAFRLIRNDVHQYPSKQEIESLLRSHSPSVLFVDVVDMAYAAWIAHNAGKYVPGVRLVAIARRYESETMLTAMQVGMREFLAVPLRVQETQDALCRLQKVLDETPISTHQSANVFCFLPAKPGVGASTICLNTATALAALPGSRVALLDFDLYSGTLDFMMNLDAGYSVRDAAEHAENLDDTIWARLVSKVGNLDVLRAGKPEPDRIPTAARLAALVRFARQHYTAVCIDLPGAADPGSLEALRTANQILLVTSPEITSIHMAGRSIELLKEHDLSGGVRVVVNRMDARAAVNRFQIEELLGVEVTMAFPNYYLIMQRALSTGHGVIEDGVLGKRFVEFADILLRPRRIDEPKPGILGYLNRVFGPRATPPPR